jgi:ketosteroid isomerase-like protein
MKLPLILIGVIVSMNAAWAQGRERSREIDAVVRAERTFRADVARLGVRDGFLAHLAGDAVLFRPGPVNGREFLDAQENDPGLLEWEPRFADVSADGTLGFTTGPWTFRSSANDTVIAAGFYATVWRKNGKGEWRAVIDHGVRTADVTSVPTPSTVKSPAIDRQSHPRTDPAVELDSLLAHEREIAAGCSDDHYGGCFGRNLGAEARLQRSLLAPIDGLDSILQFLERNPARLDVEPISGKVAGSGDLAFTYGRYWLTPTATNTTEAGHYIRIWRRGRDGWKIGFELLAPGPRAAPVE